MGNENSPAELNVATAAKYRDLIERLEKSSGPSRELDCYIYGVQCWPKEIWSVVKLSTGDLSIDGTSWRWTLLRPTVLPHVVCLTDIPRYTASLDAALALVPHNHAWDVRRNCSGDGDLIYCNAQVWLFCNPRDDETPHHWANAAENLPAIALCIAALKARAGTAGASLNP